MEDEEEDNEGDEAASASASSSAAAAAASDASPSSTGNASTDHPEDSASADPIAALDAASPEELTAMLRSKLVEAFRTAQGREPTDDEVEALLAQLSEDTELRSEKAEAQRGDTGTRVEQGRQDNRQSFPAVCHCC